jgi:hypothetical protein
MNVLRLLSWLTWSLSAMFRLRLFAALLLLAALAAVPGVTRAIAAPLLVLVLLWRAARRMGTRRTAPAVAVILPLIAYASLNAGFHERPVPAGGQGVVLWTRTTMLAGCAVTGPPHQSPAAPGARRAGVAVPPPYNHSVIFHRDGSPASARPVPVGRAGIVFVAGRPPQTLCARISVLFADTPRGYSRVS